jgi:hypothetical protein
MSAPQAHCVQAPPVQPQPEIQEQLLKAKYGGLLPKKKLLPKDHKYFDSADWMINKQKGGAQPVGPGLPLHLRPKLEPMAPPVRRSSQLGDGSLG